VFFEECIKEEQYEAKRLDIMRDAVRAKATYNIETKKQTAESGSADSSLPTSPRETSPLPTETNGTTTTLENGSGGHGDGVANGNGTSDGVPNGNSVHVESAEQTTTAA
jgi:hypothetical protein